MLGRRDSNPRIVGPEPTALPLGYSPRYSTIIQNNADISSPYLWYIGGINTNINHMPQTTFEFSKQLIKGKVAEMIFEQMLREAGTFTILGFGYEKVLPELMHKQGEVRAKETMEVIRRAPDFAIIDNDTHEVHLVEVKFRAHNSVSDILDIATKLHSSWKPAYLFLATPHGFYFGKASDIKNKEGHIYPLRTSYVSEELQEKYLELLNQFINGDLVKIN